METATMGQVYVTAKVEHLSELYDAEKGVIPRSSVHCIEVEALVDTGATLLSLPARLIAQLGLRRVQTRQARTSVGVSTCDIYEVVRLTILGRYCSVDVAAVPDDCPPLIGYVPLELLDFVVDPTGRKLIGNPRNNGEYILDLM